MSAYLEIDKAREVINDPMLSSDIPAVGAMRQAAQRINEAQFPLQRRYQEMLDVIRSTLKKKLKADIASDATPLEKDDIDMLIPHQANLRIAQFIQKKFQLSDDKVYNNIMKYGNTTAASVIIALTEAWEKGKIKDNDLVVLAAFGSGFTWGSVVIRW